MVPKITTRFFPFIAAVACLPILCSSSFISERRSPLFSFVHTQKWGGSPASSSRLLASSSALPSNNADDLKHTSELPCQLRRSFLTGSFVTVFGVTSCFEGPYCAALAADESGTLGQILSQIKQANEQLEVIPDLIKSEKWDSIRAVLIKPPLSGMWTSGGSKKLLNVYAEAIGNELPDGDEMAALELREEVISHLRYLDMAVYNNVFNPIASEGQSGATKELVRSYYEDPINEWKASKKAVDELIGLASP